MKKFMLLATVLAVLASCDEKVEKDEVITWTSPMYFYYLDENGNDLLDITKAGIQYPVHYPTPYNPITEYAAPTGFEDIKDDKGSVIGLFYSGNWSTISYDSQVGLYSLYISMPFSNLTTEDETFYVARSKEDVDTIRAEIIYITEGVIGGGTNPRHPDVQKLWYNGTLILDEDSTGNQRTFIVKRSDGTTSVYPKTKPAFD